MTLASVVRAIAVSSALAAAVPAGMHASPGPEIIIRVHNAFGFVNDDVAAAQDVAGAIMRAADIHVSWRECWRDAGVCEKTLGPTEIMVRLVTDPSHHPGEIVPLGYCLIAEAGTTTLATVYGNRVTEVARLAHSDLPTLLGRAMAHEIGHLLLGGNAHTRRGLMRAHWSAASIREDAQAWLFTPGEAEYIRGGLLARAAATPDLFLASVSVMGTPPASAATK